MRRIAAVLAAAVLALPSLASAHTKLLDPAPLTENDNAKSGPCGCYFGAPETPAEDQTPEECPGTFAITEVTVGQQIQVAWLETVNHDGAFRLAISGKPIDQLKKADADGAVVYDQPDNNTDTATPLTTTITIPDVPCESCALQLRQDMGGTFYYSCAALKILPAGGAGGAGGGSSTTGSGAGGGSSTTGTGAGGDPTSSTGSGLDSTGPGMAEGSAPLDTSGSCAAGPAGGESSTTGALCVAGLALVVVAARGRRSAVTPRDR